jgi:zinc protease
MPFRFSRLASHAALVLLLGATLATVAASAPQAEEPVLKATLKNGLRVVIVPNALAPVAASDLTYLVGSRDDPPNFPGMAHAQEHMMFRGTKNLSTSELGTLATALGGNFNASTSETITQFQFTIPAADLDAVLHVESDRMRDILDLQSEWANERGAIEQEVLGDETTPGHEFFDSARALAFAGSAYEHDGVGTREAFDRLTGPELKKFWETWYAPNNAVLVIAGNVDPQATLARIRERFESIPARAVPEHPKAHLEQISRAVIRKKSSLVYPLAAVAYRLPGVLSPDFLPSYVLQAILDSASGPVRALIDSGEALDAEWNSEPYVPEGQFAIATAALSPNGDPAAMSAHLETILAAFARKGVPEDLFATTKRRLITDQELSRNTIEALASDWATTIADDNEPSIAREQELIAAVTLDQVNRTAREYLDPRHAIVGSLTPSASASQAVAPAPPPSGPEKQLDTQAPVSRLPDWASDLVMHVAVPPSSLTPVQSKLSNGITLIVQPETISDSVFLYGNVRTQPSLQEPPGKEGVANILESMFAFGTKTADRMALQKAQDQIDASIGGGADFGLRSSTATFGQAVDLLAQNELEPRFDETTFESAQRRSMQELQTALDGSHTIAMQRAAAKLLPQGDPELREPTLATMHAVTLDDVEAYYARTFRPDLTTIVIAGDVTPDGAREIVEHAFGSWKPVPGPPPPLELPAVPVNPPGTVKMTLPTQAQANVTLEQTVAISRSEPDYIPLFVGNAILGGGSASPEQSRLFRDLRQNSGLVYSIVSELGANRSRGQFTIEYASLPSNAERISNAIDGEVTKMQTQPVDDFELALVKASLVRRTVVAGGSVEAIGSALLSDAQNGYPLDQDRIDANGYVATDAHAIQNAFMKYLAPGHFVRIYEGP